jgi:hypothetical protein
MEISIRKSVIKIIFVFVGIMQISSVHSIAYMPLVLQITNQLDQSVRVALLKGGKVYRALTLEPLGCGRLTIDNGDNPDQLSFTVGAWGDTFRGVLNRSDLESEEPFPRVYMAFVNIFDLTTTKRRKIWVTMYPVFKPFYSRYFESY